MQNVLTWRLVERLIKARLEVLSLPEGFQSELEGVVIPHERDEDPRSVRGRGGPRIGSRNGPRQGGGGRPGQRSESSGSARNFGDRPGRSSFNPDRDFGDKSEPRQRSFGDRSARSEGGDRPSAL